MRFIRDHGYLFLSLACEVNLECQSQIAVPPSEYVSLIKQIPFLVPRAIKAFGAITSNDIHVLLKHVPK